MNVNQALRSVTPYPLTADFIKSIAVGVGLSLDDMATEEVMNSRAYKQALGRIYLYLAEAPNVSQGGITFSFTEQDRIRYERKGNKLLQEATSGAERASRYGYKGENL